MSDRSSAAFRQPVSATDERLVWSGAISLEQSQDWVMPWRLPCEQLDLFPPEVLHENAACPAGVRLRFRTDAEALQILVAPAEADGALDVYADDAFCQTLRFSAGATEVACEGLPLGEKALAIWLDPGVPFRLRGVALPDGARLSANEDTRPRWITYGSSITHCKGARSPSRIWPGVVARSQGLNLTSLGFAGQCHADPMVARLIRDCEADLVSLKLGINIHGNGSLNARTFLPAILGSIALVREGHPHVPLVVCSPILSPPRETTPNAAGLTLVDMREAVSLAVERFRARGDRNLYYVDGLRLFGPDLVDLLPDDVHPNADGYERLGENFVEEVFGRLGVKV